MTGPVMQIRHDTTDRWWVAAKWPHGQVEDIVGFRTESEANDWITHELDTWLEHRRNESPKESPKGSAMRGHGTVGLRA